MRVTYFNFSGGINRLTDKLPEGSYFSIYNGRVWRNRISPIKGHRDTKAPVGTYQGLYAFGEYLLLFVNGTAYYYHNNTWNQIAGWTPMAGTGRIYAELVPVSNVTYGIRYDGDEIESARLVPGAASPYPQHVIVMDGVSKPRAIFPNGSWTELNQQPWSISNPIRVPENGILPRRADAKLYCVDRETRTKIYHSVSGRFVDFVINRAPDGGFGGDENTTFKSVDYNPITCLFPVQGGLIAGTLFGTYFLTLDDQIKIFGESLIVDQFLFPFGPVSDLAICQVEGDIFFVSQSNIHSFNAVAQAKVESRLTSAGAPISDIIISPQVNPVVARFDIYALFAIDTEEGRLVAVYDTIRQAFVSFDTGFGDCNFMAVTKANGVERLFFVDQSRGVFEAYAAEDYLPCRFIPGKITSFHPIRQHIIDNVHITFTKTEAKFPVQLTLRRPLELPYYSGVQEMNGYSRFSPDGVRASVETELEVTWAGGGELSLIDVVTRDMEVTYPDVGIDVDTVEKYAVFGDNDGQKWTYNDYTDVELAEGKGYIISGDAIYNNAALRNTYLWGKKSIKVKGTLVEITEFIRAWEEMQNYPTIIGVGDHYLPKTHIDKIIKSHRIYAVPGNHDLDDEASYYAFFQQPHYYYFDSKFARFFMINSSRDTYGIFHEDVEAQERWMLANIRKDAVNIAVFHHPPYTNDEVHSPGASWMRWDFSKIDLVLCGHAHLYQRYIKNNTNMVVLGPSGSLPRKSVGPNNAVIELANSGYLKLYVSKYTIYGEWPGDHFEIQSKGGT